MASPNLYEDNKGKVTKESGGTVRYVECHSDEYLENIQCELSPEQIVDFVKNGETVVLLLNIPEENRTIDIPVFLRAFNEDEDYVSFASNNVIFYRNTPYLEHLEIDVVVSSSTKKMESFKGRYTLTPVTH